MTPIGKTPPIESLALMALTRFKLWRSARGNIASPNQWTLRFFHFILGVKTRGGKRGQNDNSI